MTLRNVQLSSWRGMMMAQTTTKIWYTRKVWPKCDEVLISTPLIQRASQDVNTEGKRDECIPLSLEFRRPNPAFSRFAQNSGKENRVRNVHLLLLKLTSGVNVHFVYEWKSHSTTFNPSCTIKLWNPICKVGRMQFLNLVGLRLNFTATYLDMC